jgi:hypothetical protein
VAVEALVRIAAEARTLAEAQQLAIEALELVP